MKHKDKERVMKGQRKLNSNTQNVKQKDTERETEGHRMCTERTQNVKQKDAERKTGGHRTWKKDTERERKVTKCSISSQIPTKVPIQPSEKTK